MIGLVTFVNEDESTKKRGEVPVLINPAHVGAVLSRETYTTLIVSGKYIHVADTLDAVLDKLGVQS